MKNYSLKRSSLKPSSLLAAGAVAAMLLGGATTASAQTVLQNFTGNFAGGSGTTPAGMSANEFIPPDTMGAVGTNDYIQLINGGYSVYSKSGVLENANGTTDSNFWAAAGINATVAGSISDPHILFDPSSGHWFASEITVPATNANQFLVAVSNDSNPLDGFKGYAYNANTGTGNRFADFDMLGINSQGVYVGANLFSAAGAYNQQDILTVSKTDLLSGAAAPASSLLYRQSGATYGFGVRPVIDQDNGGTAGNLSESALGVSTTTYGGLNVDTIGGTVGATTLTHNASATFADTAGAGTANQKGGDNTIDTGDDRFSGSVVKQGGIIYAANTLADPSTGLADIHIVGVNASTGKVVIDQLLSGTGKGTGGTNLDLYYPSLAINASGTVVIGYTGSGPSDYASSYVLTGSLALGGKSFNFGNAIQTAAGQGAYDVTFGGPSNRWGDYSSTTVDPTNPNNFWTVQEFAIGTNEWGTQITEISTLAAVPEASTTLSFGLLLTLGLGGFAVTRKRAGKPFGQISAS